jgi:hypothetical protein
MGRSQVQILGGRPRGVLGDEQDSNSTFGGFDPRAPLLWGGSPPPGPFPGPYLFAREKGVVIFFGRREIERSIYRRDGKHQHAVRGMEMKAWRAAIFPAVFIEQTVVDSPLFHGDAG